MASLTQWTEIEQTLGDSEGQGSLVCYYLWGHKESDKTQRLNNNNSPATILKTTLERQKNQGGRVIT